MAIMNKKRVRFLRRYVPYNTGEEAVFVEHVAKKLTDGKNPWAEYVTDKTLEGKPIKPVEAEAEEPEAKEADVPEPDAPSKREELEALSVDELKKQLGELGLPVTGKKAELVDRLLEEEG